ncbi:MAG: hypothetical protein AAGJ96_11370 [Pseudomonadota bacterium]
MDVYTLVATLGRREGDGLPERATGGGMMLYAPGRDEKEAVNDAARLLKEAGLNVLELGSEGTEAERGDISDEERALMEQARAENSVVVVQTEAFYEGS